MDLGLILEPIQSFEVATNSLLVRHRQWLPKFVRLQNSRTLHIATLLVTPACATDQMRRLNCVDQ